MVLSMVSAPNHKAARCERPQWVGSVRPATVDERPVASHGCPWRWLSISQTA